MTILVHFVFHFLLQELTPKLLDLEVSTSSDFTLVTILVGSCFSNLLLFLYSIDSFLKGLLLILDTVLQSYDSLVPLFLLMLNILHEIVKSVARLQLLLLSHSLLFKFLLVNLVLASERFLKLIRCDLKSNQVFLHSCQHMNKLLLPMHLRIMFLNNLLDSLLCVIGLKVCTVGLFLNQSLLFFDLLYAFL